MDEHIFETLKPQGFQKSHLYYKAINFVTIGHSKHSGSVCVLCLTLLAWHLKITQHSQQTSKQRTFLKEREKKWQNNTFTSNVYICVLVFIINQHNGWKVLICEIQIKMIHYPSTSKRKATPSLVRALEARGLHLLVLYSKVTLVIMYFTGLNLTI